jgi:outer membrane protein assembly factor BamD (BamD/ComL family)
LGSKAYTDKKYDLAIEHYSQADTDVTRDEIREKARYKLGWCHFRKGEFDAAGKQFKKQAEGFSEGKLYADGLYMIAQCAFRADNFKEAYQAYTVAKPAIEEYGLVDERVKKLTQPTLLNGARSGNETKNFKGAAEMATALADLPEIEATVKQEALLELGIAQNALGNISAAKDSLTAASAHDGETGAHAKAMLGDIRFKEAVDAAKEGKTALSKEKFSEAIETYNDVSFGYGGSLASKEVKSWQAYAAYEAARCFMVQINDAADVDKIILIGKAIDKYQYLIMRFPDNNLVTEAKKQLKKLNAIKEKISK